MNILSNSILEGSSVEDVTEAVANALGHYVRTITNQRCKDSFVPSETIRQDLLAVSRWVVSNPRPGLIISGNYGDGKTTTIKAMRSLMNCYHNTLNIQTAKEINDYCSNKEGLSNKHYYSTTPYLAIDDLGFEPRENKQFGNISTPVIDILETRYALNLPTIITTNQAFEDIEANYSVHLVDRLTEAYDFITFSQPSHRPYVSLDRNAK